MKRIKLTMLAILIAMYQLAITDNGIVKAFSWILLIGLSLFLLAQLEKRYGLD